MTTKSDAECESAIKQFSEIAECDEAFAHSILQDVNYDLETALTKYFSGQVADAHEGTAAALAEYAGPSNVQGGTSKNGINVTKSNGSNNKSKNPETVDISDDDEESKEGNLTRNDSLDDFFDYNDDSVADEDEESDGYEAQEEAECVAKAEAERKRRSNEIPMELVMMTWNIDGIDSANLQTRFTAVLHIIAKRNPEIIFLQEVVPEVMPKLMDLMENMYNMFLSNAEFPYFCVTLISKNIEILNDEVIKFEGTKMGRGAIIVEAKWHRLKLRLINTHLESMAEHSAERKKQLAHCFKQMKVDERGNESEDYMTIFAGDLNVREAEVEELPKGVKDAWIENEGGKRDTRFTWDTRRNDNKELGGARMRFDRVYYHGGPFRAVDFSLDGFQRIRNVHCFPSDHFAVVCRFHDISLRGEQSKK